MQPHEERVVTEKTELDSKIAKLTDFLKSDVFSRLDDNEKLLLRLQASAMVMYSAILETRIESFTK